MQTKETSLSKFDYPNLEQEITAIFEDDSLPTHSPGNGDLKRWQRKEWPSAINFSTGDGRYNAPDDTFGVCYMADKAVSALAESFGRLIHKDGRKFVEESVIKNSRMCLIRPLRPLVFVDVGKLLGMLHITLDVLVGDDYTVAQRVIACLYKLARDKFDGVCYLSRHFPSTDFCYAVWESDEERFEDVGMKSLAEYHDSEYMPSNWKYSSITAEELLEDVLRFKIVPL
ncbi:RES family NAD+ phosphorylase [Photorhabdus sp. SF281]|uniref:RES family NAD+ phosphorylase n=1 Tax=Photorhabdus sp. SF281 TaxID=3459527 RepID=UPI004044321E